MLRIVLDSPRTEAVLEEERRRVVLSREVLRMEIPGTSVVPPEPDYFYGISGGLARYDARTLDMAVGDPVLAWPDASEQVGEAGVGNVLYVPAYTTAPLPGVEFGNGTSDYLQVPAEVTKDPRGGFTTVALATRIPTANQRHLIGWGIVEGGGRWWSAAIYSPDYLRLLIGTASAFSSPGVWVAGRTAVVIAVWDATEVRAYIDGVQVVQRAYPAGFDPRLDVRGRISYGWGGPIHDLLFFDRALTSAELTTVSAALNADWGI